MGFNTIARACAFALALLPLAAQAAAPYEKWNQLSERDKTFLRAVFSGDEAKAVEYAQVANINPNSIGGEPLSVWFYRNNLSVGARPPQYRNLAVQRLVFEHFRQNANPHITDETNLNQFCQYSPVPENIQISVYGSPAQKQALLAQQQSARASHYSSMAASFASLTRYGLRDRHLVTQIFIGCVFNSGAKLDNQFYETVLKPMIAAGADINGETQGGERPIQAAVRTTNADLVEHLVQDGAEVNFAVRHSAFEPRVDNGRCRPSLNKSLYAFSGSWVRSRDTESIVRIVRALASKGASPTTKYGSPAGGGCVYKTFYDAVVDAGNLELASAIKASTTPAAAPPNDSKAVPASAASAPTPLPSIAQPMQVGAWRIDVREGRLTAATAAVQQESDHLSGLYIECFGGRLAYRPVGLLREARTLWMNSAGDVSAVPITNGLALGPAAVVISKTILREEAAYAGQPGGAAADWTMQMSIHSDNGPMSDIKMGGFSKMRAYMLANCKK